MTGGESGSIRMMARNLQFVSGGQVEQFWQISQITSTVFFIWFTNKMDRLCHFIIESGKIASVKSAFVKIAPVKSAPRRFAAVKSAPVRFAS